MGKWIRIRVVSGTFTGVFDFCMGNGGFVSIASENNYQFCDSIRCGLVLWEGTEIDNIQKIMVDGRMEGLRQKHRFAEKPSPLARKKQVKHFFEG